MSIAAQPRSTAPTLEPVAGDGGASVSVIIPVAERPHDLVQLYRDYAGPLGAMGREVEYVFVLEPYFAPVAERLRALAAEGEPIRVLMPGHTVGEASLLKVGAEQCSGEIIVTLPAYYRVVPDALPELVRRVDGGADLAVARRWPRRDKLANRIQTRAFHVLVGGLVGNRIRDVACGVRAMRTDILREVPIYGDFFRFLPILAHREGYRVDEVDAPQHPRDAATRIHAPGVYLRRLIDALGLMFLVRFTDKPLRFFGLTGIGLSLAGVGVLATVLVQKFGGYALADRPLLLLGVLLVVLGAQAIALGLVGEIIVHVNAPRRRPYRIARTEPDAAGLHRDAP